MARTRTARITAVEPTPRDPLQVRVLVAGRVVATIARTRCDELALKPGDAWNTARAARVAALDAQDGAREAAFRRLGRSAMASAALIEYLVRTGHAERAAHAAVADLIATGWLDDAAYARSRAEALLERRPLGQAALAARLEASGVEPELAASTAETTLAATAHAVGTVLAREAKAARRQGVRAHTLAARLARRGFDDDAVAAVLRAAGYPERDA